MTSSVEGEFRKNVLPNGIRIVTERIPHVRSVAIGVWVDTGSRHEPFPRRGVSHFIEHLVFKGTDSRTAEEIAKAVDSVGGQMDAFTTKEHTCFYVTVLDLHLPLAADLLSDILLRPLFATDDIEREKTVVLQEFRMVDDTPDDLIHDLFAERVWSGHPLGRPILGDKQIVLGLDRETILAHFVEEYCPGRITIAAAGRLEHDQLLDLLGKRFQDFQRGCPARDGEPPVLTPRVDLIDKPLEQVHFVLGGPGLRQDAPERYVLYLLNTIVGGSMSSRLFQEVRERQGLVYSIYSGNAAFRDTGLFYVYAGTEREQFPKVLRLVLEELGKLKREGVTAEELARAKDHLKGSLMLSLESTSSRMTRIAKQELYFGHYFGLDEILAAVDRVTLADVEGLVGRLLGGTPLSLVALGPVGREPAIPATLVR
ncbi:MAG: insulinase family protein [Candidatus Rokubacteria bacterium]|nr:insulinase family protein [Candidatus Rokubacteria bacterium]